MAEGPILIPLVPQGVQRAGAVNGMLRDPRKVYLQDADIKEADMRRRIFSGEIFYDLRSRKTLAVDRHPQVLIKKCLWLARTKNMNIARRAELFYQLARGIVVSINQVNIDSRVF